MATTTALGLVLWSPRILGIMVSAFIGMFAFDAFSSGKPFPHTLVDFFVHLIPAMVLLGLVLASFRRPLIGALAFIGLAIFYALTMSRGRADWMLGISGPLLIVGALFLLSWSRRPPLQAS